MWGSWRRTLRWEYKSRSGPDSGSLSAVSDEEETLKKAVKHWDNIFCTSMRCKQVENKGIHLLPRFLRLSHASPSWSSTIQPLALSPLESHRVYPNPVLVREMEAVTAKETGRSSFVEPSPYHLPLPVLERIAPWGLYFPPASLALYFSGPQWSKLAPNCGLCPNLDYAQRVSARRH